MIVKNEALTLPRLAASVAGNVDFCTIVDTGSTDATVDIARRLFPVPGQFLEDEWHGFGAARNVATRAAAGHSDWLLFLDADETLDGGIDRSLLRADADGFALARRSGGVLVWLPRLVASARPWAWKGRTHEHLGLEGGRAPRFSRAQTPSITHHGDGGSRADKYERDLALLDADWHDNEGDPRTAFYIARTYDDMDRFEEAAAWYRRRLGLGGWDEERWFASYRLGVCLIGAGSATDGRDWLQKAWQGRPYRAEPLAALAECLRADCRWAEAWHACQTAFSSTAARPSGKGGVVTDSIFVEEDTYRWRVAYEASIAAWYVGERKAGLALCDFLLAAEGVPEVARRAVEANRPFYSK